MDTQKPESNELPIDPTHTFELTEESNKGSDQGGEGGHDNGGNHSGSEIVEKEAPSADGLLDDGGTMDSPKNLGGRPKGKGDSKPRHRRTRAEIEAERKAKGKEKAPEPQPEESQPEPEVSGAAEFDEFVKTAAEDNEPQPKADDAKAEQPKPQEPPPVRPMISGYMLLIVIDTMAPSVVITILGWAMKSAKDVKAAEIRLTKDQLQALTPLADQVAEIVFSKMHPINALFISMAFMYTGNLMAVTNARPKKIALNEQKPSNNGDKKD